MPTAQSVCLLCLIRLWILVGFNITMSRSRSHSPFCSLQLWSFFDVEAFHRFFSSPEVSRKTASSTYLRRELPCPLHTSMSITHQARHVYQDHQKSVTENNLEHQTKTKAKHSLLASLKWFKPHPPRTFITLFIFFLLIVTQKRWKAALFQQCTNDKQSLYCAELQAICNLK